MNEKNNPEKANISLVDDPAGRRPTKKYPQWRVWLGIGVSLLCLFLIFGNVHLDELWRHLQQVSLGYMALGLLIFLLYLAIAAKRWQLLLTPLQRPTWTDSFLYGLIGLLVNNLLPLRAGEVVKAVLMANKIQVSKSAAFATVVVERLLDMVALLIFVVVLTFGIDLPAIFKQGVTLLAGITLAVLAFLWFVSLKKDRWEVFARRPRFVPNRLWIPIFSLLRSFMLGLQTLQTFSLWGGGIFYSIVAWSLVVVSAWFFLIAVGLRLDWYAPLFLVVATNLGGLIPSSPGSMGVFHALVLYSLSLWSVDKEIGLTMAIIYHESTYLLVTALGMVFLWRENYSLWQLKQLQDTQLINNQFRS
jgi:uncharacterized protein (TIRG00374 family)